MRPEALVFSDQARPIDQDLARLLRHCGLRSRHRSIETLVVSGGQVEATRTPVGTRLLAVNASALAAAGVQGEEWLDTIGNLGGTVLMYDMSAHEALDPLLRAVTSGWLRGVTGPISAPVTYEVSTNSRAYTGVLTGVCLGPTPAFHDFALDCAGDSGRLETIIYANGHPLFVRAAVGTTEVFVIATDRVLSLDRTVDDSSIGLFSQFAPVLMLVRGLLGSRVWQPGQRSASLVIDDPLLKTRFGYLDYERLLQTMDRTGFATSIAFIPVNRQRTKQKTACLLARRNDRFSLCVHGWEHTGGEFGTPDVSRLRRVARLARESMEAHRRDTGMDFDDVMVFPQGVFSAEALGALREEGYLAAANSVPLASHDERPLSGAEVLGIAVRRYDDLPLFRRRYPNALHELVVDLFLGRPALIVMHPSDFKHGHDPIVRLVDRLNSLASPVWCGLGRVAREAYVVRHVGSGRAHVVAISDQITLRNDLTSSVTYLVARSEDSSQVIRARSGSKLLPIKHYGKHAFFLVRLDSRSQATIVLERERSEPLPSNLETSRTSPKVLLRRRLSEFRDEYLVRSDLLYRLARRAMRG